MLYRSFVWSLLTCALILTLNACGTAGSAGPTTSATIRGTVVDSSTGANLDSAKALHRRRGDTLSANANGTFTLDGMAPGLYLFDVNSYGYHTQRHVAALVQPGDETVDIEVPLLPQTLQVKCGNLQAGYHSEVQSFVDRDSNAVRLRLIDLFAQDGEVRVQPVVVSNVSAPLFLPDNLGPRSHFDIELVDAQGNPVPYHYQSGKIDDPEVHRIYRRGDILVAVPEQAKRLEPSILELEREVPSGTALYARMSYDFALDDTLRPTEVTDFPQENLDSLQVPVYDTLRVDGSLLVPDSLIERRDTTVVEVVGVDTTVTRDGYLLYNTKRDTNAFKGAQEAVRELYVPDSVKARARLDSLIAQGYDTSRVAQQDTALQETRRDLGPIRIVNRDDTRRLDSLILDDGLVRILQYGIPRPGQSLDSLRLLSDSALAATVRPPELQKRTRNLFYPLPDSTLRRIPADSLGDYLGTLVRDSLVVDSLIRKPDTTTADSLALDSMAVDSMAVDSMAVDSMAVDSIAADTMAADTVAADTARADTAAADSVAADTVAADSVASDSLIADSVAADTAAADTTGPSAEYLVSDTLTVGDIFPDTLPTDSLRARLIRAGVETDSIVVDSIAGSFLDDPPIGSYYYVPEIKTDVNARVLVLGTTFRQLRARAVLDSARVDDLLSFVPERVGEPPQPEIERVVQQIILVPTGGYRTKYLETWAAVQQENLREHYCEIFRVPLRSQWRSTTTR